MATYGGTTQKCKACEKTVYFSEELSVDGKIYHRTCFRCHHCRGTLKLSNYSSIDGVLYCKPHYDQLFMLTGTLDKIEGGTKPKADRSNGSEESRASSIFVGTQDKCVACQKTVYPLEKISIDAGPYHKSCFRCSHGGCQISPSNYVTHEGKLYCKVHFMQLFLVKGNFSKFSDKNENGEGKAENGEAAASEQPAPAAEEEGT